MQPSTQVTREFVKTHAALKEHELDALDALYPELFDEVLEQVSARFQESSTTVARMHISALVAAKLFEKLGTKSVDTEFEIRAEAEAAEAWLLKASANTRPSIRPPTRLDGEDKGGHG